MAVDLHQPHLTLSVVFLCAGSGHGRCPMCNIQSELLFMQNLFELSNNGCTAHHYAPPRATTCRSVRLQAEYEEADWIRNSEAPRADDDEEEGGDDDEDADEFYCVACDKRFRSDKQLKNHERWARGGSVLEGWSGGHGTPACQCPAFVRPMRPSVPGGQQQRPCMHACMHAPGRQ